jgi:hypothetical protein
LSYFQFARVYQDGSAFSLVNKPEFLLEYSQTIGKTVSASPLDLKQSFFYLWDEHFSPEMIAMARRHKICNALGFIERFPTHYDLIAFAQEKNERRLVESLALLEVLDPKK